MKLGDRRAILSKLTLAFWVTIALLVSPNPSPAQSPSPSPNPSSAHFYPQDIKIILHFSNGETRSYPAANYTDNPRGDPCTVGSHGPCPAGHWFLHRPSFPTVGTDRYRRVGPAFFLIGRRGSIPFRRDVGLHAGSNSHLDLTFGCIRMSNSDMKDLLDYVDQNHLVVESLTIPGQAPCKDTAPTPSGNLNIEFFRPEEFLRWQAREAGIEYPTFSVDDKSFTPANLHEMLAVTPHMDGGAAEQHATNLFVLLEKMGDTVYSDTLKKEPQDIQHSVVRSLDFVAAVAPSSDKDTKNWKQKFPLTYSLGQH